MLAFLFSLIAVHAQTPQEELNDKVVAAFTHLRRMNAPQAQPPVAFLVRQRVPTFGDDVSSGLIREGEALPETLYKLKLEDLSDPSLAFLFDQHSPFMNFVRDKTIGPRYAVMLGRATAGVRAALLKKIATITLDREIAPLAGDPEPTRNTAFLVEVEPNDLFGNGLSVNDLAKQADYSVDLDGFRLDIHQGFRLKAALEPCAAAVEPTVAQALAAKYPNLGPPLRPRLRR